MPLEDLFSDDVRTLANDSFVQRIYECFGVLSNPFPSAAETSGHPHLTTEADAIVDQEVKLFIVESRSRALAVTASQGIGKTNLLNAYETALREKLMGRGFFIIRYVADPEPSFDSLIRSIFEYLGEDHLRRIIEAALRDEVNFSNLVNEVKLPDMKSMFEVLINLKKSGQQDFEEAVALAHQWLVGFPVRKMHREQLHIYFRLDTVESKTRALRDIVLLSAELGELRGIFILLDELEKQFLLSKTTVLRYLSALRALIDSLPRYLFLMVALTTDALERYREMLPALKGRLANEVQLPPIRDEKMALAYWKFYLSEARKAAKDDSKTRAWTSGNEDIVKMDEVGKIFAYERKRSSIEGVRQRDFLNALHKIAAQRMTKTV